MSPILQEIARGDGNLARPIRGQAHPVCAYGANFEIAFIVDSVLALTAGMLIGESIRILRGHSEYSRESSGNGDEFDIVKEV
ncbi:hypothetical protein IX51_06215 [uncultured archaeon]|nr:hypothetical protein IX51_06215 [uncultured archaeon]